MSMVNFRKYSMFILLAFLSVFIFGCENKTPVKDIYFAYNEQITMLVNEQLVPTVVVTPSYATNSKYTLYTSDEDVVKVVGSKIVAVSKGFATIRVVSNDNKSKEDMITVNVEEIPLMLDTPARPTYTESTETININTVSFATGYTLKVNGIEVNIGNSTKISLSDLEKLLNPSQSNISESVYDNLLTLEVRANAPSYTKAYENSAYSQKLDIYQNGVVEDVEVNQGILTFKPKTNQTYPSVYTVVIDGVTYLNKTEQTEIDLNQLNETYAGKDIDISVVASTKNKSADRGFFTSKQTNIVATVLDAPSLSINDAIISWNGVNKAEEYVVAVNGVEKLVTKLNYLNIHDISGIQLAEGVEYSISVTAKMPNIKNVIKTRKYNSLRINKLAEPTLNITSSSVYWSSTSLAYAIKLSVIESGNENILIDTNTLANEFSMMSYESGKDYKFVAKSVGKFENGVYYISSNESIVSFSKNAVVDFRFENHKLKFNATEGNAYLIKIDDNPAFVVEANVTEFSYDLSKMQFAVGVHSVEVCHLGNIAESKMTGAVSNKTFMQLGGIESLTMYAPTAPKPVELTEPEEDETEPEVEVFGVSTLAMVVGEHNIENNAVVKMNIVNNLDNSLASYKVNTTETFVPVEVGSLEADNYFAYATVEGNGTDVFSYLDANGKLVKCNIYGFVVLDAPTLVHSGDKEKVEICFNEVAHSTEYRIYSNDQYFRTQTSNSNFTYYGLSAGKSVSFTIEAIGDGVTTISSVLSSELTITKLKTPTLTFDNVNNVVSKVDNNNDLTIYQDYNYTIEMNGDELAHAEFNEEKNGWLVGSSLQRDNYFTLKLTSNKENYINSEIAYCNVHKIQNASSTIYTNSENKLVFDKQEYYASISVLEFDFGTFGTLTLTSDGNTLNSEDGSIKLPFTSSTVTLYENFNPIIPTINEVESFAVRFKSLPQDEYESASEWNEFKTISKIETTTLSRIDGTQNIVFSTLENFKTKTDFKLLVNGQRVFGLSSDKIVLDTDAQTITLPIDVVSSATTLGEVNTISVITNNTNSTEDAPTLYSVGAQFEYVVENKIVLSSSKDNSNQSVNNSVNVKFAINETDYTKVNYKYNLYIYNNELTDGVTKVYTDSHATENEISFYLDEIDLDGTLKICAFVETTDNASGVHHFNSPMSSVLTFTKVNAPAGLYVSDSTLHFSGVGNIVGYEIYEYTGTNYVKVNTDYVLTNSYSLAAYDTQKTFAVKAVSVENNGGLFTNSKYSETITINKPQIPSISASDGKLLVTFDSDTVDLINSDIINSTLVVTNGQKSMPISITKDKLVGRSVYVDVYSILNYGDPILEETLTAYLLINSTVEDSSVKYINSNTTSSQVYGLLAPINVQNTTDKQDTFEYLEFITWQANNKNILETNLNGYYEFKVEYKGKTYYSTDSNLVFKNGDSLISYVDYYGNITTTKVMFPYGYNQDGTVVPFKAGNYEVSVRVVPANSVSYNLCYSKYSEPCTFEILATPTVTVVSGVAQWQACGNATNYLVKVYDHNGTEPIEEKIIEQNYYTFADSQIGIYGLQVQALNTNANNVTVINGAISDVVEVYRLPTAQNAYVDDGRLYVTASKLFTTAKIELIYSDGTTVVVEEPLTYSNAMFETNLTALGLSLWNDATDSDMENIESVTTYKIDLKDSDVKTYNVGYSIYITLHGNTSSELGIVNGTRKLIENVTVSKLTDEEIYFVTDGVLTFANNQSVVYNRNINNQQTVDEFMKEAPVFKVEISASGAIHNVYAIDYEYFVNTTKDAESYVVFDRSSSNYATLYGYYIYTFLDEGGTEQSIYFNVFENNKIDFKNNDKIFYYAVQEIYSEANTTYIWSGETSDVKDVNLVNGGTFTCNVKLLGGDMPGTKAFLTSSCADIDTLKRYSVNSLITKDGFVYFVDLEDNLDNPIYRLTVSTAGITEYWYIYSGDIDKIKDIINEENLNLISEYSYERGIEISGELFNCIKVNLCADFEQGLHILSVKTFAGLGKGNVNANDYLIDSKESATLSANQLNAVSVQANNGVIQFARGFVKNGDINDYYDTYEVTIIHDGNRYVKTINSESEGVEVDEVANIVKYTLPTKFDKLDIVKDLEYEIKVRPITSLSGIVNAKYFKTIKEDKEVDSTFKFKLSSGVSEVSIKDGKLQWKANGVDNVFKVKITFDTNKTITFIAQNTHVGNNIHEYVFSDDSYAIDNSETRIQILNGVSYKVEISSYNSNPDAKGYTTLLSRSSTTPNSVLRLATVKNSSIKANDGILTWEKVENAVKYEVVLNNGRIFEVEQPSTELVELDLAEKLDVGNYTFKIRAIGDNYVTAINSLSSSTITMLDVVDEASVAITGGNKVDWSEVPNAQGYKLTLSYNYNEAKGEFEGNYSPSEPLTESEFEIPADLSFEGDYLITIQAVGVGVSYVLNGAPINFKGSADKPAPVTDAKYDETLYGFTWITLENNITNGDVFKVRYKFNGVEVEPKAVSSLGGTKFVDEQTGETYLRYFYPIFEVGVYTNFEITVERNGTLSSSVAQGGGCEFNLYKAGDGSVENPYLIETLAHLQNIAIFPSANYKIVSNITITSETINNLANGYLIAEEFSGSLTALQDGSTSIIYTLYFDSSEYDISSYNNFALFGTLKGANISYLGIESKQNSTKFINSFAFTERNMLNLSIIAGVSINNAGKSTVIDNVKIGSFEFELNINATNELSGIYVAGLVGSTTNTTISNCSIENFKVTLNNYNKFYNTTYLSGVVAKANANTTISSSEIKNISFAQSADYLVAYAGGMVAYASNVVIEKSTVSSLETTNFYAGNFGGIVGLIENSTITECETSVDYTTTTNLTKSLKLGGIAGCALSTTISDSTSQIEINIANLAGSNQWFGAVCGEITSGAILNCTSNAATSTATVISNQKISQLGIYGKQNS